MIDFTLYDFLEKIVSEQKGSLETFQEIYGSNKYEKRVGINAVQSIVRRSVIEETSDDPSYSKVVYTKNGYQSIKLSNLKFDFEFILSLLSNVPGLFLFDTWAIIMVVLTITVELRHCKVELSPLMGIIISYLYRNGYHKKKGRYIFIEDAKKEIQREYLEQDNLNISLDQFDVCINNLADLKIIEIVGGEITLIEEIKI